MSTNVVTETFLKDFFSAFNHGDLSKVMAYFSDDCIFEAAAGTDVYGTRFCGIDAIRLAFEKVYETFPDVQWRDSQHFVSGNRGVSEWVFTGTLNDGSRVEANGVDLFTFDKGKIIKKNAFRKDRPLLSSMD